MTLDNIKEEILDDANGKWEVPGGKIEFGETREDAVKRELMEETGYNVIVKEIIPYSEVSMWEYTDYIQHTVIFFYICELENDKHTEIQDNRINAYKWVKADDLSNYNFLPGNKEAIQKALEKLGDRI